MKFRDRASGLLLVFAGVLLISSYFLELDPLNEKVEAYLDRGIKATLASYVIVRGINAGVSVIKGSEVYLSPAGMGFSIALGEVLDPLDDITERVSTLLLISFISLGLQRLLLELLSGFLLLLAGALALLTGTFLLLKGFKVNFLLKLFLLALVLRFLFPATVLLNDVVYEHYISPRIEAVNSQLSGMKEELSSTFGSVRSTEDLKRLTASLRATMDSAFDKLLTLALYLAFQTVLLPILNLWLTFRLSMGTLKLQV